MATKKPAKPLHIDRLPTPAFLEVAKTIRLKVGEQFFYISESDAIGIRDALVDANLNAAKPYDRYYEMLKQISDSQNRVRKWV